jgi:hypothetical protein
MDKDEEPRILVMKSGLPKGNNLSSMPTEQLKDFHWVRANLFHDWEGGDWRVVKGYGPVYKSKPECEWDYEAECDDENQRIYIAPESSKLSSKNKIRELFVHEISHAVSGSSSHKEEAGSKWPNEMARAAERARGIGEHELADLIEKDREEWMNTEEEITP